MLDSKLIESISATALSPIDLFLALHFGLGVEPALLRLEVSRRDLIDAIQAETLDGLLADAQAPQPWDKTDEEAFSALAIAHDTQLYRPAALVQKLRQVTLAALKKLLRLAATPEQRLALADAYSFSYDDLTSWIVRADLLRLKGVDLELAELLALAVRGVHDLAFYTDRLPLCKDCDLQLMSGRRVAELRQTLGEKVEAMADSQLKERRRALLKGLDLPQLVELARDHAERYGPQIVTTTEALLIVKGAGAQAQDDTLNGFLNGFWPALKAIQPHATITERRDVFTSGYLSSPHDDQEHLHCTEIQTGERRIWIKESYWEHELRPPSALTALRIEWRMATYAFGSMLYELFSPARTLDRGNKRSSYFWAFFAQYWAIFIFLILTFWNGAPSFNYIDLDMPLIDVPGVRLDERQLYLDRLIPPAWNAAWSRAIVSFGVTSLLAALVAGVFANLRAQRTFQIKEERKRCRQDGQPPAPLPRLPTLSGALIWIALVAFLGNPLRYLLGLVVLILLQALQILAREIAWPLRPTFNSDVDYARYYVAGEPPQIGRADRRLIRFMLSPVLYRFTVLLGLPVTFFVLMVVSLLGLIPGVQGIVSTVKTLLSGTISGFLGDVAIYATDPAQAHQIRSVVEADITFFHLRPDISQIHVFAHSQGTPITFETLFHYLADPYRQKIKSYITIGSILSYYHQANPVLDELFVQRFPRHPYPQFAPGFRWINLWNFNDPITEFYGLDEYQMYDLGESGEPTLAPASPTNIKTDAHWFPYASHGEYWSNIHQVHAPLAYRLLGDDHPEEWQRLTADQWQARPWLLRNVSPLRIVGLGWLAGTVALAAASWGLWLATGWLWRLGATNPEIDSIYRWLISDWSLPFTSEKLSLAWLIRPIVDNEHTMRELIWLALLVGLLALLLLGKPWIARGLQTYLAVPDKTRAQPPEYIPAASPPALDAAPAAERAVGEES